jgi:hypothetical protein
MQIVKHPLTKKYLTIGLITLLGVLLAGCASGLFPQFTYQGVLTDAAGNPLDGSVSITYSIYKSSTGGTAIYSESETVTVTDGRFDSIVGPSTVTAGLSPEDLSQPLWIEIQIDDGTYDETLSPRQKLYGAPYAFTLMPGSVISSTMNTSYETYGINAVTTIQNEQTTDPIPALRVVGDLELVNPSLASASARLYSEMDVTGSDLYMYSNDNFQIYLDHDQNEIGTFYVYGDTDTNEYCYISDSGNFGCTGSKSSVADFDGETRALYAIESPDVWFEDFGNSTLNGGSATVQVDSLFAQSVNLDIDYLVFLTPLGDCNGLYVTNKTATGFEVHELGGGSSNVSFDYRIVAKRAGYEDVRMEVVEMDGEGMGQ